MKVAVILLTLTTTIAADRYARIGGFVGNSGRSAATERAPVYLRHPYRTVNGRYCDLTPILKWEQLGRNGYQPMRQWQNLFLTVQSSDPRGILARDGDEKVVHITNYPNTNLTDGSQLIIFAVRSGTYRYKDIAGATHNVENYDYGTPADSPLPPALPEKTEKPKDTPAPGEKRIFIK